MSLRNSRVVITGATHGIGYELVRLLIADAAQIIGLGRDADQLERMAEQFSGFSGVSGDLTTDGPISKLVDLVSTRWGAVDILINNAGILRWYASFEAEPATELWDTFAVNLVAVHRVIHALVPFLRQGNSPQIINVSSGAGTLDRIHHEWDMPSYRLSKYALDGLTVLWANALRDTVAVTTADPGWVKTNLGGPNAPGEALDGARRIRDAISLKSLS